MRMQLLAVIAVVGSTVGAMAQDANSGSPPREIGNRANGYDYEPTPGEVVPREKAAGVRPSAEQQRTTSQELQKMDKSLLRSEGLSTKSVPNMTNGR